MSVEQASRTSKIFFSYFQLTKPRIILLFTLTGLAGLLLEGSLRDEPLRFWMVVLGILLSAGSANALNQYIDRDIDSVMARTKKKRPIPRGLISPTHALNYALAIGVASVLILYYWGSPLASFYGFFTIAFYIGIYTLWLKRSTPYNIVIGGAAGATAPLIGWAAGTNQLSLTAWIMFLIVFMWTPPHFWALALCVKDEYSEVSVPMLPVVKGEHETRKQILIYSLLLIPLTLLPYFMKECGIVYFVFALVSGLEFLRRAFKVYSSEGKKEAWGLFGYSIAYLLLLFIVIVCESLIRGSA